MFTHNGSEIYLTRYCYYFNASSNKLFFFYFYLLKNRYPSFVDALRDLDDPLALCSLFCTLRKNAKIRKSELIPLCRRLLVEFLNYVISERALKKVREEPDVIEYMKQRVAKVYESHFSENHKTRIVKPYYWTTRL